MDLLLVGIVFGIGVAGPWPRVALGRGEVSERAAPQAMSVSPAISGADSTLGQTPSCGGWPRRAAGQLTGSRRAAVTRSVRCIPIPPRRRADLRDPRPPAPVSPRARARVRLHRDRAGVVRQLGRAA